MFLPKAALVSCLSLFLFSTAPVWAETTQGEKPSAGAAAGEQPLKIFVPPKASEEEALYTAAVKALPKEQADKLEALDKEYHGTLDPGLKALQSAKQVKYCESIPETAIAKDHAGYAARLGVYRNELEGRQLAGLARHMRKAATEAPFIDSQLLLSHYDYSALLMLAIAEQLSEVAYQTGGFKKTDCEEVRKRLEESFNAANTGAENSEIIAPEKVEQLRQAAAKGEPEAMINMGMFSLTGKGMPRDAEKGMGLLAQAAETGYGRGQYMYGLVLATNMFGTGSDREKAKYWLEKAAAQGNKKAEGLLKNIDKIEPEEGPEALKEKAEKGDAGAQYSLAGYYRDGLGGVEINLPKALELMLLSAGQGYPLAESDVAVMMLSMNKPHEGIAWMTKAARNGVTNSQYELANIYSTGQYMPKYRTKALTWFKIAAEAGDGRAIKILQQMGLKP